MLSKNQPVLHSLTDPETGNVYVMEAKFGDKDIEIDLLYNGVPKGNVMIEVYNGKAQVVIANQTDLVETGGENPEVITLFEQH